MKLTITLIVVCILIMHQLSAQNNFRISGIVVAKQTKLPVQGATIKIKFMNQSSLSGSDGRFSIVTNQKKPILTVSHIGYKTLEVPVEAGQKDISIIIEENEVNLEEITVSTGYQQMNKENTTGSFDKIDEKLLNRSVSADILSRLDGTASSVYFSKTSDRPSIFIRGISTINAGTSPLIVVDNFPYEGNINNINPNDVSSITILKDAAASAIWGARAGNGVIVITTKKGTFDQKTEIVLNVNTTIEQKPDLFKDPDFLNTKSFIEVEKFLFSKGKYNADFSNSRKPVISPVVEILLSQRNGLISESEADRLIDELQMQDVRNDYSKYLYRNSVTQQYSLNLSGGSKSMNYFVSGGWDNGQSTLIGNTRGRATFYSTTTIKPAKNIELNTSLNYSFSKDLNNSILPDLFPGGSANKTVYYPYARLADTEGNPVSIDKTYRMKYVDTVGAGQLINWKYIPLEEQNLKDNSNVLEDIVLKMSLKYQLKHSLNAELIGQVEKSNGNQRTYYDQNTFFTRNLINLYSGNTDNGMIYNVPKGGILDNSSSTLSSYAVRGQVNYKAKAKNSYFDIIAGGELRQTHSKSEAGRTYGFNDELLTFVPVDNVTIYKLYGNLGQQSINNGIDFSNILYRYLSLFSNAAFTYKNKYTVSFSGRRDASNLFGVRTNQKWNPLWSTGIAWKVSDELFYDSKLFPFLRLRMTYGYNGNFQNNLSALSTISYQNGEPPTNLPYALVKSADNPDLRWEKTGTFNVALDFALKNNRLQGSIEYYRKNSMDLLSSVPLDATSGIANMAMNAANLSGKGIDIKINSRILDSRIKWDVHFLFSYVKNKVTRYLLKFPVIRPNSGLAINPMEGLDPYALISYKWGGLDNETGNPIGYKNGEKTQDYREIVAAVNFDDMVISGSTRPPYFGNFISAVSWKDITVSVNISYRLNYYFRKNSINYGGLFDGWKGHVDFEKRWLKPGDEQFTNVPSMVYPTNRNRDAFYSSAEVNVVNGGHVRLQDINISYNPTRINKAKYGLKNVILFTQFKNLGLLWRKNTEGIDPDYTNRLLPGLSISSGIQLFF